MDPELFTFPPSSSSHVELLPHQTQDSLQDSNSYSSFKTPFKHHHLCENFPGGTRQNAPFLAWLLPLLCSHLYSKVHLSCHSYHMLLSHDRRHAGCPSHSGVAEGSLFPLTLKNAKMMRPCEFPLDIFLKCIIEMKESHKHFYSC